MSCNKLRENVNQYIKDPNFIGIAHLIVNDCHSGQKTYLQSITELSYIDPMFTLLMNSHTRISKNFLCVCYNNTVVKPEPAIKGEFESETDALATCINHFDIAEDIYISMDGSSADCHYMNDAISYACAVHLAQDIICGDL